MWLKFWTLKIAFVQRYIELPRKILLRLQMARGKVRTYCAGPVIES
jgi:hypothetical protein